MRGPAYSPPDGLSKEDLEYDMAAPRVYCFITRFPFFQLHFNMLYHLLGKSSTNSHRRAACYLVKQRLPRGC